MTNPVHLRQRHNHKRHQGSHPRHLRRSGLRHNGEPGLTGKILPIAKEWQLESVYAVVFLDTIHFRVRSEGQPVKKAVYIAIGINLDGRKDVLGMCVGENESDKFWATVLNGLRNRGVEDIFIACTENLIGFSAAIEAAFPKTEI